MTSFTFYLQRAEKPVIDDTVLNDLQNRVRDWKARISAVLKTEWDLSAGTTINEVNFWAGMAKRLADIEQQLKNPVVGALFLCWL